MKRAWMVWIGCWLLPFAVAAQVADELGFELGVFRIYPELFAEGFYDDRVAIDAADNAIDDFYSELGAALALDNGDARYRLVGRGVYGRRKYDEYTNLDNDFYSAAASVGARNDPLQYGIAGQVRKSLDYDTANLSEEPGAILTTGISTRYSATADIGYEWAVSERTALMPSYDLTHYFQEFEEQPDAEWQIHRAGLQLAHDYSARTVLTLSGYGSMHVNDDEDGAVGTVALGARSRSSDKTSWDAEVGISAADYEQSGSAQGFFGALRAAWQATEKVSFYASGSSGFQPGYGGGAARQVRRLGYGAEWRPWTKWSFDVQSLHDYQEEIGSGASTDPANEQWRHFISAQARYRLTDHFVLTLGGEFNRDEKVEDQRIVSLRAVFIY